MTTFGKYEVVEQIGQGGFGKVYKGWDPVLKRHVAIKTCTFDDAALRRRFVREAEVAGGLRHPNIVTVHDFGEENGEPYLVQEFLEGEDLDQLIERGGPRDPGTKFSYLRQIAAGLGYAHEHGVVHRDVKPSNIRVGPEGHVSIMDFGIAKLLGSESRLTQLTQTGMPIGTVGYMSPEQVEGGDVDRRSDIFSFGVLVYELFAGRLPFDGNTVPSVFYQIVHLVPPRLDEILPGTPPGLSELIDRCLAKAPDARYQSFPELLEELDAVARRAEAKRGRGRRRARGAAAANRPSRRNSMRAYLGLIVAAAAVAVFGILNLVRSSRSSPIEFDEPDTSALPQTASALPQTANAEDEAGDADGSGPTQLSDASRPPTTVGQPPRTEEDASVSGADPSRPEAGPSGSGASPSGSGASPSKPEVNTPASGAVAAGDSPADPPARALHGVLVLVFGDDPALSSETEDVILSTLSDAGFEVSDETGGHMRGAVAGTDLGSLGREAGVAILVSGELRTDAVASVGGMYTGSALLSVRAYDVSAGRLILSETFRVGAGNVPGKLGGTPDAARSEAVSQVGHQAAARLRRDLPRGGA